LWRKHAIVCSTSSDFFSLCPQCEHVAYTLVPITGKSDLIKAFEDNIGNGELNSCNEKRCPPSTLGCQMAYVFSTQKFGIAKFWRVLQIAM
jgi:hypothetical protein